RSVDGVAVDGHAGRRAEDQDRGRDRIGRADIVDAVDRVVVDRPAGPAAELNAVLRGRDDRTGTIDRVVMDIDGQAGAEQHEAVLLEQLDLGVAHREGARHRVGIVDDDRGIVLHARRLGRVYVVELADTGDGDVIDVQGRIEALDADEIV